MASLEEQLVEAGNTLLQPPSSVDELLLLLDQVENCLSMVEQSPSKSMQTALSPSTKALVADDLLRHPDSDVKVAVASCISEITRITAPDAPYNDDEMKDVFQLIVSSFENLSDKSSRSYHKRTLILETVAKVRSCVVMLDLECDGLIIEMFQHFLKAIRDYHPENVFSSMETIMTLVLEESEDISLELISPILASVKKDNQEFLPIARKLGKRVFENCAIKLKPCLTQAKESLGFSLDDYSKIISSICDGTTAAVGRDDDNGCGALMALKTKLSGVSPAQADENKLAEASSNVAAQVSKENVTETRPGDHSVDKSPKSGMSNGVAENGNEDRLADPESLTKSEHAQQADQSVGTNVPSNAEPDDSDSGKIVKSESKFVKTSKKKGRKTSFSIKSTKPSDNSPGNSEKYAERLEDLRKSCSEEIRSSHSEEPSVEVTVPSENEKETIQLSSPNALEGDEPMNVASPPSPSGGVSDEGRLKKAGRQKKKENVIQGVAPSNDGSKKASEVTSDKEVKPKRRTMKKARAGSTPEKKTPALADTSKSEGGTTSDSEAKPLKQLSGKRRGRGKATSEKDVTKSSVKDDAKEMVSSPKPASKSAKDEGHLEETSKKITKRKRTAGKERASDTKEYGANLVGSNVKVWWPDDEKFYEGVITSFDSDKQKHTVLYTDGEEEILNLREEKLEFIESDSMPDGEQATEGRSPDPSPGMRKKKAAKTNSEPAAKQGKMEGSRGGKTSSSKLKFAVAVAVAKSGRKSGDGVKIDGISKENTPKSGGKSEDDNGGKSKDQSKKSSSKSGVASRTPGKSKDVDGGMPKTSTKSKQDTTKTATKDAPKIATKGAPKTATKVKGKGSGGGDKSDANGSGKARSASGKAKETEEKGKSPETAKTPEGDVKKSGGKKRRRGAKS